MDEQSEGNTGKKEGVFEEDGGGKKGVTSFVNQGSKKNRV
jgi:hypothetical protein